jgi:hypothetical protein
MIYKTALVCAVYPNYSVFMFKHDKEIATFESPGFTGLSEYYQSREKTYGFNSLNYVIPLINSALNGNKVQDLYFLSKSIIERRQKAVPFAPKSHLDLIDLAGGYANRRMSLYLLAARQHLDNIVELDFPFDKALNEEQKEQVKENCVHKLTAIEALYNRLESEISIREILSQEFGINLMNMSNARISETIFSSKIKPSDNSVNLSETALPTRDFQIGDTLYCAKSGGLHSKESSRAIVNKKIVELDVISYYPSIILKLGVCPPAFGKKFMGLYRSFVERRIQAKKDGNDTFSAGLKMITNTIFGQLNCSYSCFYSPSDFQRIIQEGQNNLLDLIQIIEANGNKVVSANTDGIFVVAENDDTLLKSCSEWEKKTGFNLARSEYMSLYSKDVNNYFAITKTGFMAKGRGVFGKRSLQNNPSGSICAEAVIDLAINGIPLRKTITGATDLKKFLFVSSVEGGAVHETSYIGKVIRYYLSRNGSPFFYRNTRKKVEKTENARPLMVLPEKIPGDLDYELYIDIAKKLAESVNLKPN